MMPGGPSKKSDFKVTEQELASFEKHMKDPKFRDLFADYLKEISDPKNKQEYDSYLSQLENDGGLPSGSRLIKPTPVFCIKFTPHNQAKLAKVYVNICHSSVLEKASPIDDTKSSTRAAIQWRIPHAISPPRTFIHKDNKTSQVFDAVFNPTTVQSALMEERIQRMIVEAAIHTIVTRSTELTPAVSDATPPAMISNTGSPYVPGRKYNYKRLNDSKYMGDAPPTMIWNDTSTSKSSINPTSSSSPPPSKTTSSGNLKAQSSTMIKGNTAAAASVLPVQAASPAVSTTISKEESNIIDASGKHSGLTRPTHRITYRNDNDISVGMDTINTNNTAAPAGTTAAIANDIARAKAQRPTQLVIVIDLPQLTNGKSLELDISSRRLVCTAPPLYHLDITLPYPVDDTHQHANAAFNSKQRQLTVTLPVMTMSKEELELILAPHRARQLRDTATPAKDSSENVEEASNSTNLAPSHTTSPSSSSISKESKQVADSAGSNDNDNSMTNDLKLPSHTSATHANITIPTAFTDTDIKAVSSTHTKSSTRPTSTSSNSSGTTSSSAGTSSASTKGQPIGGSLVQEVQSDTSSTSSITPHNTDIKHTAALASPTISAVMNTKVNEIASSQMGELTDMMMIHWPPLLHLLASNSPHQPSSSTTTTTSSSSSDRVDNNNELNVLAPCSLSTELLSYAFELD